MYWRVPYGSRFFLLWYLGLLRIEEVLSLQLKQVKITRSCLAVLSFPESKGSKLKGEPETVIIKDRLVVMVLNKLLSCGEPNDFVVGQTYRRATALLKSAVAHFGLVNSRVTSHGLRRGSATWHFSVCWVLRPHRVPRALGFS